MILVATYNNEDNIKWNDLATSLQDIIMRKITWNMLHPDLQSWLLDKERRIIELERWRRTKADPMLDDHERRIGSCESQISSLWSKLGDVEDDIDDIETGGGPSPDSFSDKGGWYKFPNGLIIQWGYSSKIKLTFPIAFPNKCLNMQATREYHKKNMGYDESWREPLSAGIVDIKSINQNGAVMTGGTSDTDGGWFFGIPGEYYWLALGY